jgi:hypothetical protein
VGACVLITLAETLRHRTLVPSERGDDVTPFSLVCRGLSRGTCSLALGFPVPSIGANKVKVKLSP